MVRKPELNDALLLALAESGEKGLEIVNLHLRIPEEFKLSIDELKEKVHNLSEKGYINIIYGDSVLPKHCSLTKEGELKAHNIQNEIDLTEYVLLITRVSPELEIRKRLENIETYVISVFFVLISFFGLKEYEPSNISVYIDIGMLIFFSIILIISLMYSISSLVKIIAFWGYYTRKQGRIRNYTYKIYTKHERKIKFSFKYIMLPIIAVIFVTCGLGIMSLKYAIGVIILSIVSQYILKISEIKLIK